VLGARKVWGFLIDLLEPSLAAALRNKGAVDSESSDTCGAVSKLVQGLREVAMGTSSNITLRLSTLHKIMSMKCDITTDPQVYLDKFTLLKSRIDLVERSSNPNPNRKG